MSKPDWMPLLGICAYCGAAIGSSGAAAVGGTAADAPAADDVVGISTTRTVNKAGR